MLNALWLTFFFTSFAVAIYQSLVLGNHSVFPDMMASLYDMAKLSLDISIGLIGLLALWLGFFRVAESAGVINIIARGLSPLFHRLMPEIPRGDAAIGSVAMNLSANVLGLDNAATPMGLKAMRDLQSHNPSVDTISNAQILFLVLNTSSVTLIPVTVFLYRAQLGAANPADVFLPIVLATSFSTLVGLSVVAAIQRIKLWDPVVLAYIGGSITLLAALVTWLSTLEQASLTFWSNTIASVVLLAVIACFLLAAQKRKLSAYNEFIEGAKEGFSVAINLIPYLVAMLVAIGIFRASGAMDSFLNIIRFLVITFGLDTQFVDALPTAFMKPLSGSGARGMMIEAMQHYGADSLIGRMVSVMQGSTETTLYVLTVYCGAVGIQKIRHALWCGLIADCAGIVSAIGLSYWFFA